MSDLKLDKKTVAFVFDNIQDAVDLFDGRCEYGMIDDVNNPLYKLCLFMSQNIEKNAYLEFISGDLYLNTIFGDLSGHGSNDIYFSLDKAIETMFYSSQADELLLIAHKLKLLAKKIKKHVKASETKGANN